MLEQKIRLKNAIERKEPVHRVVQFWNEYCEAYERLHKPSEKHIRDYCTLMDVYTRYIQERKKNV
jgi:hypothetical protein